MKKRIAFIAHNQKKDDIVDLAAEYADVLRQCILLATGGTGKRLSEGVGLNVERMLSGPSGGDLQIGAAIAEGNVDCLIFLRDPMTLQPHEPDVNAMVRVCDVHSVACATNMETARALLSQLQSPRHPHHS